MLGNSENNRPNSEIHFDCINNNIDPNIKCSQSLKNKTREIIRVEEQSHKHIIENEEMHESTKAEVKKLLMDTIM